MIAHLVSDRRFPLINQLNFLIFITRKLSTKPTMTNTEIKTAVMNLNKTELRELLDWLEEYQESLWDKQIEDDRQSGKLDTLIKKAKKEFREGKCRQL